MGKSVKEKIDIRHLQCTPRSSGFADGFIIRQIETLLQGNDMTQPVHRHTFFYVLVLEKGAGEHVIDFTTYPIHDNSVFFIRPCQVHQLALKAGSKGYLIEFNADFYMPPDTAAIQVLRKVSHKNYCPVERERFKNILSILANMLREFNGKQERYLEAIKSNLNIFFIELSRQSRSPKTIARHNDDYMQERLEEFIELVEQNMVTNKEVSFYASKLHMTNYQLNAIIKTTLGRTCSAVINEHIILQAKRGLLATTSQVNQIAYDLGYEDVSYFIRFFKKHTGHSPEAFRQNFK